MLTKITGTGSGIAPVVNLTFPFIDKSHVKATVDGVAATLNWTGASQVTFADVVGSGSAWVVYRDTPTAPLVDFTNGSVLTENDLDLAHTQRQYVEEELADGIETVAATVNDPEAVRDTIAAALVAGANVTITPNDAANTITITATDTNTTDPEVVRDTIAAALVGGTNVTITPNDAGNTITISATDTNTTDPEVVRDTMAAALVAGANITITPNDAGDTITIAATGGGGGGLSDGDKGDVVISGGGTTMTVESATPSDGSFNITGDLVVTSTRNAGLPAQIEFDAIGKVSGNGASVAYVRGASSEQLLIGLATGTSDVTDGFFGTLPNISGRIYFLTGNGSSASAAVDQAGGLMVGPGLFGSTGFTGQWKSDGTLITAGNITSSGLIITSAAAPASPVDGQIWYDSALSKFRKKQGGVVSDLDTAGGGGLSDGDYGDVVVGGTGTTMTVQSAAGALDVGSTLTVGNAASAGVRLFDASFGGGAIHFYGTSTAAHIGQIGMSYDGNGHFFSLATDHSFKSASGGSVFATITATGLNVTGEIVATGAITGSNLSGTNTGDQPEATNSQAWTGTSAATVLTPNRLFGMSAEQALVDGATITPDFNAGVNFGVTLGGNRTLANPTNAKSGQSGIIVVTQDGTGSRTLSYGSNWKFPGGAPALSTAAGSVDVISYFVRPGGTILATLTKAFA